MRTLMITGAWLDEVVSGLSVELANGSYPGEEPWAVAFEMLCGTIGRALKSAEACDVELAIELIDLAGSRVEEHLRLRSELSHRIHEPGTGDRRTHG